MLRKLGRSDLAVSAMGFGCWAIGGEFKFLGSEAGWGAVDDNESIAALHAAFDQGITFYDTAANYGCGHSERILGRAFADRRDRVVIATKFGHQVDEVAMDCYDRGDGRTGDVVTPLRADCEASLRRLGTDYIDLYQFHVNGYNPAKAAEVRDALEDLVAAGKVRSYGWSTDNPEGARVFAEGEHCVAIQHDMNVVHDAAEVLAVCEAHNLASINRAPLAMGVLTGKYGRDAAFKATDVRAADWFRERWLQPVVDNLDALRDILTSDGRTLAQGALAWLWGRSELTIPIPGIRTVAQAEENAGAMGFGPLTPAQMDEIERLLGRQPEAAGKPA
ncbi:MAG: aldo/keto reductase [Anaerolineae bacterium]|nr:aldo/keto reductase [Anaerolineae bacterium]